MPAFKLLLLRGGREVDHASEVLGHRGQDELVLGANTSIRRSRCAWDPFVEAAPMDWNAVRCDNRLPRAGTGLRGQEEKLMERRLIIGRRAAPANALAAGLFATAVAAQG